MAHPESFIGAARQFLVAGKKRSLSRSLCLSLAVQVLAVDTGLKPALVYDTNAAGPDQVRQYLNMLQKLGLVTKALHIVAIDDNVLIVNLDLIISHLEEILFKKTIFVIDVSQSRGQPALVEMEPSGIEKWIHGILGNLRMLTEVSERSSPNVLSLGEELCAGWNLCSLFGILLGFPAAYWFDQKRSFENCLSMVPLVVTKASASWDAVAGGCSYCFTSYSVPAVLASETRAMSDTWTEKLQKQFSRQSVLSALTISTETVSLPSVSL
ncbi:hypothetical protein JZ751_028671 [Albula glossodonta]|uniref:Uncharacterized protein n=1 Tax=Albula glossodonta TaxID=121402 RepID=A0A8T2NDT4_9TELE|nr:hypothetical protein JZ751_028671 [Albula glossodonta]